MKICGSVYGGGTSGRTRIPIAAIAMIDLASELLERTIGVGANIAPHSGLGGCASVGGVERFMGLCQALMTICGTRFIARDNFIEMACLRTLTPSVPPATVFPRPW